MEKHRFNSPVLTLLPSPRPGEREIRFPQPKDRHMHRPRKETDPLV